MWRHKGNPESIDPFSTYLINQQLLLMSEEGVNTKSYIVYYHKETLTSENVI